MLNGEKKRAHANIILVQTVVLSREKKREGDEGGATRSLRGSILSCVLCCIVGTAADASCLMFVFWWFKAAKVEKNRKLGSGLEAGNI